MKKLLATTMAILILVVAGLTLSALPDDSTAMIQGKVYNKISYTKAAQERFAERLSQAIQFKTISARNAFGAGNEPFERFNEFLKRSFPKAMSSLTLSYQSGQSLLLSLEGRDPSLAPILMIAHSDVVPAQTSVQSAGKAWSHPPFSGLVDEQYIWGRGTLDNKSAILAIMESLENRAQSNAAPPERTLYFAFTHDEEVGGHLGAKKIAAYLNEKNIRPYFILDEGQAITQGVVPNVEQPVALIGVTQKGYMTIELSAEGEPGHSMMPPKATAISNLSEAIHRLTQSPMPPKMTGPIKAMFRELSHQMTFPSSVLLYHTWLTEPLVNNQLAQNRATDALIRTSMSVNVIKGGIAENVLPKKVSALMNYRIAPHNTSQEIIHHVEETIAGTGVNLRIVSAIEEPAPITSHEGEPYKLLRQSIQNVFPNALVAPSITLSTTDSRHFADLSENILRFSPIFLTKHDLPRFHGIDERISKNNYVQMIEFYTRLFQLI